MGPAIGSRTNYLPKGLHRDYVVGLSRAGSRQDPYQSLYLNYGRGGELNYNGHCNPQVDALIDSQSIEADQAKRKRLIREIERELAEDGTRPIIFYDRRAICRQTQVKVSRSWSTASSMETSGSTISRLRDGRSQ